MTEAVSTEILVSPVKGTMIPVSEVKDETFAAEILGTTVAIEPENGQIKAPCDGEVMNIFETGHAVSIVSAAGGELLIHAGIDTVKMSGKGFKKFVSDGDRVHKGDVLLEMDLDEVKKAGYETTTMMIVTNADDFDITKADPAPVTYETEVMTIRKK